MYLKSLNIIAVIALLLAIPSFFPYGYFVFLRILVTGVSLYNVSIAHKNHRRNWVVVMIMVAILFNPLFPVYLEKELWIVIDVVVAGMFFIARQQLLFSKNN